MNIQKSRLLILYICIKACIREFMLVLYMVYTHNKKKKEKKPKSHVIVAPRASLTTATIIVVAA